MPVQEQEIKIVMRDPHELQPYVNNPRHNEAAVEAVARSIEVYGFINPIVHDANHVVIAGDTRLKAALLKGLKKVPCIAAAHLTPKQVQAYRIADNKIAEVAEWDDGALKAELEILQEIGFDIADTGFSQHEIEQLFAECEDVAVTDSAGEIDLEDYTDENYNCKCPRCGFLFNS